MKAFISYSFNDLAKFENLCYALDKEQVDYWKTEEIAVGQPLRDKLREAVTNCAVCVFLATENSLKSGWCLAEVGAFWGAGKPVLVYLEDDKLNDTDLPKELQGDKWTRHLREVVNSLTFHLQEAAQNARERRNPFANYNRDSMALYALKVEGMRNARSDVWLIGATMHHTLSNIQNLIVEKIVGGIELNVVVADPLGKEFEMTAHSFGQEKGELEAESITTLKGCRKIDRLLAQQASVAGRFNVRLIDEMFTAGVYFFDPKSETGRMMLVPHVPGQDAAEVPAFVFQPTPEGPLEHYLAMYERVWSRAIPFKIWTEANSSYLA